MIVEGLGGVLYIRLFLIVRKIDKSRIMLPLLFSH